MLKYSFEGANFSELKYEEPSEAYYNYYTGNDTSKWVGGVRKYNKLTFLSIYPLIDLEYEVIGERFKYNFILNPGAKLSDIRFKIDGHDGVSIQSDRIVMKTRFGEFSEVMPLSFEVNDGQKKLIQMKYIDQLLMNFRKSYICTYPYWQKDELYLEGSKNKDDIHL